MSEAVFHVRGLAWLRPGGVVTGAAVLDPRNLDWQASDNAGLDHFSAKEYVTSVKGYLDPAGSFFLAVCSSLRESFGGVEASRIGVSSLSFYGAQGSGQNFFNQLHEKGARLASPLIFPHSYANTAGNLAAIEFSWSGPHMVFSGCQDVREGCEFALARLQEDDAEAMVVGFYEALPGSCCPPGLAVRNGALAFVLSRNPGEAAPLLAFTAAQLRAAGSWQHEAGAVQSALLLLSRLAG